MLKEQQIRELLTFKPFLEVAPDFQNFCLAHGRVHHFNAKQYLYFAGDDANNVYFLLAGRVRLYLMGEFNEKILRVINPPAFFPDVILDGKPYPHAALCIEETDVLVLGRETLLKYLETNPRTLWAFYKNLALDLRRSYRHIKNLSLGDARLRLGAKLYALAHVHGRPTPKGVLISIPISATDLAGMCSLARESVSRILGELKDIQLLEIDKKWITVREPEKLRAWIHERSARSHSSLE